MYRFLFILWTHAACMEQTHKIDSIPAGQHHFKLVTEKGEEKHLFGCCHIYPFSFLPGYQQNILNSLVSKKDSTLVNEQINFYHQSKLDTYVKILDYFVDKLTTPVETGFFESLAKNFFSGYSTHIEDNVATYFASFIQKISKNENLTKIEFIKKLPQRLVYDTTNAYLSVSGMEYELLRQKKGPLHALDQQRETLFFPNEQEYLEKDTGKLFEGFEEKNYNKQRDFLRFLSWYGEVDRNSVEKKIKQRYVSENFNNQENLKGYEYAISQTIKYGEGYWFYSDEKRNIFWLKETLLQNIDSANLVMFGAAHFRELKGAGILDFFFDLSKKQRENFWKEKLGKDIYQKWQEKLGNFTIERLGKNGSFLKL